MFRLRAARLTGSLGLAVLCAIGAAAAAQPSGGAAAPGEVAQIAAGPASVFLWTPVATATSYNV